MDTNTTRRTIIAGAGLATIVALSPVCASALPVLDAVPDAEWNRLVADYERAHANAALIGKEHDAASAAYAAGRKLLGERPVAPGTEYPRAIVDMTVGELRSLASTAPTASQTWYEDDLASWTARGKDIERQTMGDVDQRWDRAVTDRNDTAHAVFAHPAPTVTALCFKLDLAEREYLGFDLDQNVTAQIFADVRRFTRGEA